MLVLRVQGRGLAQAPADKRVILQENTDKLGSIPDHPRSESTLIILQKYLFREWLWTFLAATVVLLVVLVGLALGEILNDISNGRVPPGLLTTLILLEMPEALTTILPLAVFIAVIWGLGRLYRDQEMAVMRACGFHWRLLMRPLFALLLPVAALLLLLGLHVVPLSASTVQLELEDAFRNASEWGLQTGQFHVLRGGDLVLYVAAVETDGRSLRHVFIQQRDDEREQIWAAERGYYWLDETTGNRYLTLENGQITEGQPGGLDFGIMEFSRNDLKLPELRQRSVSDDVETRSTRTILASETPEDRTEIQWRLSPAIVAIVLGLMAIPLSHSAPREGRGGRALLGIFTYIVYANALWVCRKWMSMGDFPTLPGLWWIHLLVLGIALIWLQRQGRMAGRG